MLTILLASTTSVLFGCSNFLGGLASRRDSAFAVTANAHLVGLAIMAVAVLLWPAPFTAGAVGWGAAAGVASGIGVVALYGALALGRMGVVAPLTAALSGSLPAVYDFLVHGTTIRPLNLIGLVVALVAILVVSTSGDPDERAEVPPLAIGLAILAGVGFTGGFICFSLADKGSGLVPILAARVASVAVLVAVTLRQRGTVSLAADARPSALGAGLLDAGANVTMLTAIRIGPLAVASVLGSLFPVVTILLARIVLGERLRAVQRIGVVLALTAVVLTSIR